jgi:hypothetical protein
MASQPDINQLIQKTRRYEFSDGLRDIQFAILLGFGGVGAWLAFEPFWLTIIIKAAKTYGRWVAWIGMLPTVLVLLAVWGMLWLMKYIRQRWLWRESGMVKSSQWIVPRKVNLISFIIILAGLAIGVCLWFLHWVDQVFVLRMLWTATGWSFGYTLVSVGKNIGLPRYIWLGWAGGIISTSILIIPLTFGQSALVFGSIWFVILMTSGIMTLRSAFLAAKSGNS